MKAVLIITAIVLCSIANGQEYPQNITQIDSLSVYIIRLNDNTSLSGKILERNSTEIVFYDITIGKVTIPLSKIASITRHSGDLYCILTTNDNKTFTGLIVSQNEKEVTLKTESLGDLTISNTKIKDIKIVEKDQIVNGKYFFPNPHPTRYFFGPSAIPLEKGEGYFQNVWVFANSVQIGITDHFSMGGGMVIPILFFITPKFGYKVSDYVHLGGGAIIASTISKEIGFGVAAAYGSVTLGTYENNFTLNAGWGAVKQEGYNSTTGNSTSSWALSKRPMFTFSGMIRVARKFALVTENWVFSVKDYNGYNYSTGTDTYTNKYYTVMSAGFRFLGEKSSFDFGLAVPIIKNSTFGLPYLDYVFKF
ncbi:MAG TPA: hypothetical protein VIK07_01865 [Bacteroidales bacterium]